MSDKNKKSDKKKGNKLKVDFAGVEVKRVVPEGDHHLKVKEITVEDGNAAQYLKWKFAVVDADPKVNGQVLYHNTSLAPQSLWNLRNLLETLGVEVPDSELELELSEYVGLEMMGRIEHEEYDGKPQARLMDFTPIGETAETKEEETEDESDDEEEEEADEEEEAEDETEEEEDGKVSAGEVKEMDDDELKSLVKKHKLKVDLSTIKKASKRVAAVIDALEKADLLGD